MKKFKDIALEIESKYTDEETPSVENIARAFPIFCATGLWGHVWGGSQAYRLGRTNWPFLNFQEGHALSQSYMYDAANRAFKDALEWAKNPAKVEQECRGCFPSYEGTDGRDHLLYELTYFNTKKDILKSRINYRAEDKIPQLAQISEKLRAGLYFDTIPQDIQKAIDALMEIRDKRLGGIVSKDPEVFERYLSAFKDLREGGVRFLKEISEHPELVQKYPHYEHVLPEDVKDGDYIQSGFIRKNEPEFETGQYCIKTDKGMVPFYSGVARHPKVENKNLLCSLENADCEVEDSIRNYSNLVTWSPKFLSRLVTPKN